MMLILVARRGVVGAAVALTVATSALMAQAQERFRVPGQSVAVYNLAGRITVSGGSGSETTVRVVRAGPDAARLRVETGPIDNYDRVWQTLRVVYPGSRLVVPELGHRSRTEVKVREDGTFSDAGRTRGRRVTISNSGTGVRASADLEIGVPQGTRLGVYLAVGQVTVQNVEGMLRIDVARAPVTVVGATGTLTIDSGSGTVDVRDVDGDLSIDTGSGAVTVANAKGERCTVETGSGAVTASGITAQTVAIETGSGRVEIRDLAAVRVSVETGSGRVALDLTQDPEALTIETGSGSVVIQALATLGAQVDLETNSGHVETDFPVTVRKHRRNHLRGQIGDGAGRIRVETGSGGIRLVRRS